MVLREIRSNGALGREAVAFLDDDPALARTDVHGVRVAGGVDRLEEVLRASPVAEVIVSSAKIAPERLAQVREVCEAHGVSRRALGAALRMSVPTIRDRAVRPTGARWAGSALAALGALTVGLYLAGDWPWPAASMLRALVVLSGGGRRRLARDASTADAGPSRPTRPTRPRSPSCGLAAAGARTRRASCGGRPRS